MKSQITYNRVLKIALPMVISNATVPILGAVDTGVIGQLGDQIILAAVGIGAVIISTIYWLFGFLRMSTTGLVAQANGAGDLSAVFAFLIRGMLIGFLAGLLIILLQVPLFWIAFKLFQAMSEVESKAETYLSIRIWAAPLSIANFAVLGWLIALERTLYVLCLQIFVNLLNIILNLIFVLNLGWGIQGVALASVISETVNTILALTIALTLYKKNSSPRIQNLFSITEWKTLFFTNVNIFIRSILLEIVIISYVFFGSTMGTVILATNHILLQFVQIASYALDGFAFSAEALVGSAFGQKSQSKIRIASIKSTACALICAIAITLIFFFSGEWLFYIMVRDELIQKTANQYLFWMAITPITGFLSFMLDGIFIGATKTRYMRKAMLQSFLVYLFSILIFFKLFENHGLWLCINIFFIARAVFLFRYYKEVEKF